MTRRTVSITEGKVTRGRRKRWEGKKLIRERKKVGDSREQRERGGN